MNRLLPLLRQLVPDLDAPGDAELLTRFVRHCDQEAFATLVRRHGALVRGVCQRWLRHDADADDAFQVVFIILARKAHSLTHPERLASWLHGVSVRTARFIRTRTARRRQRETTLSLHWASDERESSDPDLGPLLDEEVARLAEKYRLPVILCHMQGLTRRQAALRLGCPEGTLSARLARAMTKLRRRLLQRGIAPVALAGLAATAEASLPRSVVSAALRVAEGSATQSVSHLAQGVLQMWTVQRVFRLTATFAIVFGLLVGGLALGQFGGNGPVARAETPGGAAKGEVAPIRLMVKTGEKGALAPIEIREGKDDLVTVNSVETLTRYLKRVRADKTASDTLVIQVSSEATWATVKSVVDACEGAGFTTIRLKATPEKPVKPPPSTPAKNDLTGKVTSVADNLAVFSLGSDHGVEVGQVLQVYRTTPVAQYLGTLTITRAETHRALGMFQPAGRNASIQVGDTVDSKIVR